MTKRPRQKDPDDPEDRAGTAADHLPLTPAVFHVLLALADRERHGYAIMQEVEETTEGGVSMGPGTLYGTIKRLLAVHWIEESAERPDPAIDDQRRRYYRLTDRGRRIAAAEALRLEETVAAARAKRLLPDADLPQPG